MLVYKDLITGDEVCSDAYPQLPPFGQEELSEVGFEIKSNKRSKGNEDYGISVNQDEDEEEFAGGDEQVELTIDIIDNFRLQETPLTKKEYESYIKKYMKTITAKLTEANPDRVDVFKKNVTTFVKYVLGHFDDFSFYVGESMELDGGLVYSYYFGEEHTPRFVYLTDGLKEERY